MRPSQGGEQDSKSCEEVSITSGRANAGITQSGLECFPYKEKVGGSIPSTRTD